MNGKYDDMIHLPHPTSSRHPRMSMADRAAQFSPFAALTGHGAAISETARLTDRQIELSEDAKALLDQKQSLLTERLAEHPEVAVTWFRADSQKEGGRYEVAQGQLRQIDTYARCLVLEDGSRIALDTVLELEILAPEEPGE
ncbi:MAG: hypothetical protein KHW56_04475 [Clostridiales bacterium]|nr:hypothetical protein [Clostridiales bacterium]